MTKTSIDFLIEEIEKQGWGFIKISIPKELIYMAKVKHKEELKDAYEWGRADEKNLQEDIVAPEYNNAEEFYEGEYGK